MPGDPLTRLIIKGPLILSAESRDRESRIMTDSIRGG